MSYKKDLRIVYGSNSGALQTPAQAIHANNFSRRLREIVRDHLHHGYSDTCKFPEDIAAVTPVSSKPDVSGARECRVAYREQKGDGVQSFIVKLDARLLQAIFMFYDQNSPIHKALFPEADTTYKFDEFMDKIKGLGSLVPKPKE